MEETNYFQNALSGFITEAACGGAVRHLTDSGYTLDQIVDRLDYPASRAKVQRIMMAYLYESRVLLLEEPSEKLFAPKEQFVQEQDAYGRRSMRKISVDYNSHSGMTTMPDLTEPSQREERARTQGFLWKETVYNPRRDGKLTDLLHRKCEVNGEAYSYVSCPFGEMANDQYSQTDSGFSDEKHEEGGKSGISRRHGAGTAAGDRLSCLNGRQREYIQGIRWERPVIYHRLNRRMLEIISKLYEAGAYDGACFFAAGSEKIRIPAK